ncbi:MAG: hypothetical protein WDM90_22995 [Ferruginibacter sp.]
MRKLERQILFAGQEDEMEFMPIIPLNEEDDGSTDDQPIPEIIPLLA